MEVFCHINEIKELGWASLRTLVLACPKVVLWAPSAFELESLRKQNPMLPDKNELLWYVKNHHIQIMARDWWINNGEERRKHDWPGAAWVEEFDGALLEMWKEDQRQGIAPDRGRVRSEPPARGHEWAKKCIQSGRINYKTLVENAFSSQSRLQIDYIKRASQQNSTEDKAIYLLGSAKNHGEAFQRSGRNRVFGLPGDEALIRIITKSLPKESSRIRTLYPSTYKPNADIIMAAVDGVVDKIAYYKPARTPQEAFQRMQMVLNDRKEIENLRKWVTEVDQFAANVEADYLKGEIAMELAKQLETGAVRNTLRDYFFPKSKLDVAFLAATVVSAVGLSTGIWQFAIGLAIPATKPALQWLGYISEDYTGPRWPFYLAEGTKTIKRKTREGLFTSLKYVK